MFGYLPEDIVVGEESVKTVIKGGRKVAATYTSLTSRTGTGIVNQYCYLICESVHSDGSIRFRPSFYARRELESLQVALSRAIGEEVVLLNNGTVRAIEDRQGGLKKGDVFDAIILTTRTERIGENDPVVEMKIINKRITPVCLKEDV